MRRESVAARPVAELARVRLTRFFSEAGVDHAEAISWENPSGSHPRKHVEVQLVALTAAAADPCLASADDGAAVVVVEVVTYDPVRRKGFMRLVDVLGAGRVHFVLSMLPPAAREPVVIASRVFNAKIRLTDDAFHEAARSVRHMLVGQRFRAVVKRGDDGRLRVAARTMVQCTAQAGDGWPP